MQHRRRDHRCTSSPVAPNIIFSGREWTQVVYLHLPNAARYLFKHVFLLFSVPAVLARARVRQHRKHCMSRVPMPRSRDTDFEWLIATRLFPCKCVYTFAFRDIDLHHYSTFEFGQTVNTRLYVFLVMFVSQTAICSHIAADLADSRQGVSPSSSHCACTFRCAYISIILSRYIQWVNFSPYKVDALWIFRRQKVFRSRCTPVDHLDGVEKSKC